LNEILSPSLHHSNMPLIQSRKKTPRKTRNTRTSTKKTILFRVFSRFRVFRGYGNSQEVKLHGPEDLPDDLARGLAVIEQIEGVRTRAVIDERHRQIARQRVGQESVKRF